MNPNTMLRQLPAVDELLRSPAIAQVRSRVAHEVLVGWLQQALQDVRNEILNGEFYKKQLVKISSDTKPSIQAIHFIWTEKRALESYMHISEDYESQSIAVLLRGKVYEEIKTIEK